MTCLSQQHEQLPEAEPRMTIDQLGQSFIPGEIWPVHSAMQCSGYDTLERKWRRFDTCQ